MKQANYFQNLGGINITDSPFSVDDSQATGGYNYNYLRTGALSKRLGPKLLNASPNAQLKTIGSGINLPANGLTQNILRFAGTKAQLVNLDNSTFTNLSSDDSTPITDFFTSVQPVEVMNYNSADNKSKSWFSGGGANALYGYVYEGLDKPKGFITAVAANGGTLAAGSYYYAVAVRTASTGNLSNAALDVQVTVSGTEQVTITFPIGISTTIYDQWYVYRSFLGGSANFETGVLVAQVATSNATYVDAGSSVVSSSTTVPRNEIVALDKITKNGSVTPTGTLTVSATGTGTLGAGTYYYGVALRKASTNALSNVSLDKVVTVNGSQAVLVTFPTGVDTSKYDQWYVYRSAIGGVSGFTTGTLVYQVATTSATFTDTGSLDLASSQLVPRAGNVLLDNSVLPDQNSNTPYKYVEVYKKQLVTASGSTVYFSELLKDESWPAFKQVTIQSGGDITGLAVFSFATQFGNEEILAIFKRQEMWLITGSGIYDSTSGIYDLTLSFLDSTGCANQSLVVKTNGFLAWIDYRGAYFWNGSGKPIAITKDIQNLFLNDGDLDRPNLKYGFGDYYRKNNQIVWFLSHKIFGENKFCLKLDLRLTTPNVSSNLANTTSSAVFVFDKYAVPFYNGFSYVDLVTLDEIFLAGDNAGNIYQLFYGYNDAGSAIEFAYQTKWLDQGSIGISKSYSKVTAWVEQYGDWDIELDYSVNYTPFDSASSTVSQSVGLDRGQKDAASLWDLAIWDRSLWDNKEGKIKPVSFNLNSKNNANQGDSIRLTFKQSGLDQPVIIHGFTILFDEITVRK